MVDDTFKSIQINWNFAHEPLWKLMAWPIDFDVKNSIIVRLCKFYIPRHFARVCRCYGSYSIYASFYAFLSQWHISKYGIFFGMTSSSHSFRQEHTNANQNDADFVLTLKQLNNSLILCITNYVEKTKHTALNI